MKNHEKELLLLQAEGAVITLLEAQKLDPIIDKDGRIILTALAPLDVAMSVFSSGGISVSLNIERLNIYYSEQFTYKSMASDLGALILWVERKTAPLRVSSWQDNAHVKSFIEAITPNNQAILNDILHVDVNDDGERTYAFSANMIYPGTGFDLVDFLSLWYGNIIDTNNEPNGIKWESNMKGRVSFNITCRANTATEIVSYLGQVDLLTKEEHWAKERR
jgi:hypothetical protein